MYARNTLPAIRALAIRVMWVAEDTDSRTRKFQFGGAAEIEL